MARRSGRGSTSDAPLIYKVCSLLLQYPSAELAALRDEIVDAIGSLKPSPARGSLEQFSAWWQRTPALEAEQHYVQLLDLHKRSGLYLTFYGQGDKRERGPALLRLKQLYRSAGLPLEGTELPDYLPVMLEFAAAAPQQQGEIVLREHRAALELVRLSLRDTGSPYADLIDAVCHTVGEASAMDRLLVGQLAKGGPPSELVGLEPFAPPEIMPTSGARR